MKNSRPPDTTSSEGVSGTTDTPAFEALLASNPPPDYQAKAFLVLRELRAEHRLSQEQLAKMAHVSRTYLAYLEAGKREPNFRGLLSLGAAFDLTGWELAALIEIRMNEMATGRRDG